MARAAPTQDAYDKLIVQRSNHSAYPRSLLRPQLSGQMLDESADRFDKQRHRLFKTTTASSSTASLDLHDLFEGAEEYEMYQIQSDEKLDEHLNRRPKDPKCRHVFVQADNQRHPLNCTCDMFTFLLTHHQVMESFLDLVISWTGQEAEADSHYTNFHSDDLLYDLGNEGAYMMRLLGRSGKEIRHCYNLRSVGREKESSAWTIRQTIVYHTFDVQECRALWITISAGNDLKSVMEKSKCSHPNTSSMVGKHTHFETTLDTHLVIHEWCSEPWRWYINDMEDRLTKELRRLPFIRLEAWSGRGGDTDREEALGNFKELSSLSSELHKAGLVLELNVGVLEEICSYYKRVTESSEFRLAFEEWDWADNEPKLSEFIQRVSGIVRDLNAEKNRVQTLSRLLEDGKGIFDRVLQYQNLQINTRMEEMTRSTEMQTQSMHIVTLVTLVFLPATFVSTFFGSGVFVVQSGAWVLESKLFGLFAKICFPMTAIVMTVWLVSWWFGRSRGKGKASPVPDEEKATKAE